MLYTSTRDSSIRVESAQAIAHGISKDGGLFIPSEIPSLSLDEIVAMGEMSYAERAAKVFAKYRES